MTPIEVLRLVISHLENLGVPYMLGGSFASSAHGIPRSTNDADIVVDLQPNRVDQFVEVFLKEFYVDAGMVEAAIRTKQSFNVIHLASFFKIDFFILARQPYPIEAFSRRQNHVIDDQSDFRVTLTSAEDIVLAKLDWYRQGGGVSESQWRDVLGILKIQARHLNIAYLEKWANELGLYELLGRVRQEAGI